MELRPATLSDLAALRPRLPRKAWRGLAAQIAAWPSWSVWNGRPRAIATLAPAGRGVLELCMIVSHGDRPTPAELRFMLLKTAALLPDLIVITSIDDDNPAGQRMARMLGFAPLDEHIPGTRIRTWMRLKVTGDGGG